MTEERHIPDDAIAPIESKKTFRAFPSILSLFASALLALPALADITLNVTASRPSIYLGESFNLNIEVNGADSGLDTPAFPALPPADVQFLGQHSNSRSSISIVNGRMTRESFEGRIFAFQIKPRGEGPFTTGPVRVTANGKTHTHPGLTVRVAGVEQQDTVLAAVTASSTSVLVEEPFTVTLSVAVAELPEPYTESVEPLHPNLLPQLSADFLEIRQDTPGLKGPDLNQILNGLMDQSGRQPAFAINSYQTRDLGGFGSLFDADPFRPRPIRFRLASARVTRDGKNYRDYTLSLSYTPTKEGEFTFGPLTFKGQVLTGVTDDRQGVTRDIYTIGPAVTVRVVPPPDEGRPEGFIGSVGRDLQASAAFDTTVCKVGDPLTLTLELTGPVSVSNMRTPLLSLQPALTRDFRIYDDNVAADTLPNGKRFKYRVRPTREGTLEFPPVKLAYYDTVARAYTTVTTAPIPIQARPTTQIATGDAEGDAAPTGFLDSRTRPLPAGITLTPLPPPFLLLTSHFLLLLLLLPALYLLAILTPPLAALARALRHRRRHSGALARARAALRRADAPDAAARAFRAYLADRLDLPALSLTPAETAEHLRRRAVPAETADACRLALARLDEALYRPDASIPLDDTLRQLLRLLPQLDTALSTPPRPAPSASSLLALLSVLSVSSALSLLPSPARAAAPDAFLWEQANAQATSAATPADYLKAANTYNRLVADGVRNGPLFLNLGNVLVMAGDGPNAAAAFARAERHLGATPETRQGLAAALALQTGRAHADLPWHRTAFFWHYALSAPLRTLAALFGWNLLWLGLLLRRLLRGRGPHAFLRSLAETCAAAGALTAALFAASVLMTLIHERHDDATWPARVFAASHPEKEDAP